MVIDIARFILEILSNRIPVLLGSCEYIKIKSNGDETVHIFLIESDWIRGTFCENNVGIEFKK